VLGEPSSIETTGSDIEINISGSGESFEDGSEQVLKAKNFVSRPLMMRLMKIWS